MRRRNQQKKKWFLAAFATVAAGASLWIGQRIIRRRSRDQEFFYSPQLRYNSTQPPAHRADQSESAARTSSTTPAPISVTGMSHTAVEPANTFQGNARVYDTPVTAPAGSLNPAERTKRSFPWLLALIPLVILAVFTIFTLVSRQDMRTQAVVVPGGDARLGRQAIESWGCGACHTIPGIPGAYGKVGPALEQMAEQTFIAGILPNTPENMVRWIMDPQGIQPGNGMPNTGVTEPMARNMAAYLYSID